MHLIWKSRSQSLEEEWRGTESCCLKSSVKFPQSVMIWSAMSSAGVGPLCFLKSTVNAAIYQEILEHFMLPSADKLYGDADFIFQQDLAPAHTAKGTKSWFNDHGVTENFTEPRYSYYTVCPDSVKCSKVEWMALHSTSGQWPKTCSKSNPGVFEGKKKLIILQWPSQSPDLNPIEHAFHLLKTKLKAERPTNKQQLKSAAVNARQSITKEETQALVMSMSSRLKAVIAFKGFSTKY